jgi:hypothetical protein
MEENEFFNNAIEETKNKIKKVSSDIETGKKVLKELRSDLKRKETSKSLFLGDKKQKKKQEVRKDVSTTKAD